jgi:hypothetical protein
VVAAATGGGIACGDDAVATSAPAAVDVGIGLVPPLGSARAGTVDIGAGGAVSATSVTGSGAALSARGSGRSRPMYEVARATAD